MQPGAISSVDIGTVYIDSIVSVDGAWFVQCGDGEFFAIDGNHVIRERSKSGPFCIARRGANHLASVNDTPEGYRWSVCRVTDMCEDAEGVIGKSFIGDPEVSVSPTSLWGGSIACSPAGALIAFSVPATGRVHLIDLETSGHRSFPVAPYVEHWGFPVLPVAFLSEECVLVGGARVVAFNVRRWEIEWSVDLLGLRIVAMDGGVVVGGENSITLLSHQSRVLDTRSFDRTVMDFAALGSRQMVYVALSGRRWGDRSGRLVRLDLAEGRLLEDLLCNCTYTPSAIEIDTAGYELAVGSQADLKHKAWVTFYELV